MIGSDHPSVAGLASATRGISKWPPSGRPPSPKRSMRRWPRCGRSTSARALENFAVRPGRLASAPTTSSRIPSPHGSASPSEERAARRAAPLVRLRFPAPKHRLLERRLGGGAAWASPWSAVSRLRAARRCGVGMISRCLRTRRPAFRGENAHVGSTLPQEHREPPLRPYVETASRESRGYSRDMSKFPAHRIRDCVAGKTRQNGVAPTGSRRPIPSLNAPRSGGSRPFHTARSRRLKRKR